MHIQHRMKCLTDSVCNIVKASPLNTKPRPQNFSQKQIPIYNQNPKKKLKIPSRKISRNIQGK
jgi:hypothetical protein